jgi:hypothetical protein
MMSLLPLLLLLGLRQQLVKLLTWLVAATMLQLGPLVNQLPAMHSSRLLQQQCQQVILWMWMNCNRSRALWEVQLMLRLQCRQQRKLQQ